MSLRLLLISIVFVCISSCQSGKPYRFQAGRSGYTAFHTAGPAHTSRLLHSQESIPDFTASSSEPDLTLLPPAATPQQIALVPDSHWSDPEQPRPEVPTAKVCKRTAPVKPKVEPIRQEQESHSANGWFMSFSALLAMSLLAGLRALAGSMSRVGRWAARHKTKARAVLISSQLLLLACGIGIGKLLFSLGLELTETSTYALLGATGLLALLSQTGRHFRPSFLRQKGFFLMLALSGLLLCTNLGNRMAAATHPLATTSQAIPVAEPGHLYRPLPVLNQVHDQAMEQPVSGKPKAEPGDVIIKIILTLLMAFVILGLLFAVAATACSLACSGFIPVAAVWMIVGTVGTIFLGVYVFSRIWTKREVKPEKSLSPS